jgi:hypothetical protein
MGIVKPVSEARLRDIIRYAKSLGFKVTENKEESVVVEINKVCSYGYVTLLYAESINGRAGVSVAWESTSIPGNQYRGVPVANIHKFKVIAEQAIKIYAKFGEEKIFIVHMKNDSKGSKGSNGSKGSKSSTSVLKLEKPVSKKYDKNSKYL